MSFSQIYTNGTSKEKIKILETFRDVKDQYTIQLIISCLDDKDLSVRGEAFCSLLLNPTDLTKVLSKGFESDCKNIRGFCVLLAGNKNYTSLIKKIKTLAHDSSGMVRSCVLGALYHLNSIDSFEIIREGFFDSDMEVKKSAVWYGIKMNYSFTTKDINILSQNADDEMIRFLDGIKKL